MTRIQFVAAVCFFSLGGLAAGLGAQAGRPRPVAAAEELAVRYAQASLKLAEIDLRKAEEQNKKVPRTIPQVIVERLRRNVAVSEAQLEQALQPSAGGAVNVHVRYAEERVRIAELEIEKAQKARQRDPDAVPAVEVERLALAADVARLRLDMWRNPVYLPSLLDQMQWQLDRLSEEVIDLNKRVEKDDWMPR